MSNAAARADNSNACNPQQGQQAKQHEHAPPEKEAQATYICMNVWSYWKVGKH